MDKKKIFKILKILFILAFVVFIIYNIRQIVVSGKQRIQITSGQEYYNDEPIELSVKVSSISTSDDLESKVNVNLLDSNHKKVKNVNGTANTQNGEAANITINLPEETKPGKYYLQVNAKSSKGNDTIEKEISIKDSENQNITIQLDKGIYKPGDEVNYRVLVTSKRNDKPTQEKLEISFYDANDNRVYVDTTNTSIYGITSGKFKLADEVNSGNYKIQVATQTKNYSENFVVNPYITPQFETKIQTDKENYLVGEKIKITANAKYFFGEPVKNAKARLKLNDTIQEGLTDEKGNYVYEYTANENKNLNVELEITDESNYLVEAKKTIYITEDIFDIEILPEYNAIVSDIDNDIYFYVKNPDGTGKKAYLTINLGDKINRQVITNENGIGKLNLTKSDIDSAQNYDNKIKQNSYYSGTTLNLDIQAQDMNGNKVSKKVKFNIQKNPGVLIKTDKVKYNEQDDITIKLKSDINLKDTVIAVCKNDEIIKLITTNEEETTFNLGNNYGIIDIFALDKNVIYAKNRDIQAKKTIFVKPNKKLNISVETDKENYQPKENVNLKIGLTNESENSVDGALLISALDEAVLSVKDNDLSIDNIKLALSDIKLSNELDAATMYANIIDDKSEAELVAILLKQKSTFPKIYQRSDTTIDERDEAIQRIIIGSIIFTLLIILYFTFKFKQFKSIMMHLLSVVGVFITFLMVIGFLCEEGILDFELGPCIIVSFVTTLILYTIFLYKYKENITRWVIEYLIFGTILMRTYLYIRFMDGTWQWLIFALEILIFPIMFIVSSILKNKNIKPSIFSKVRDFSIEMMKTELIMILTVISSIANPIFAVIVFIVLNFIYEIKFRKKAVDGVKANIEFKAYAKKIGIVVAIVIGIFIISKIMYLLDRNQQGHILMETAPSGRYTTDENGVISPDTYGRVYDSSESSTSKGLDGLLNAIEDSLSMQKSDTATNEEKLEVSQDETKDTKVEEVGKQEQKNIEENVRSVFLESLCFIPELVTQNGNANTEIKLSDNITSWKIQVVGNTIDGNVGYGTKNIIVKKDFFADFTLPTNTIVDDNIEIPLTVYNYTQNALDVAIDVTKSDWFELGEFASNIRVEANSTKMEYIPIKILKAGNNSLKIKATSNNIEDILQKNLTVKNKGLEVSNVVSSGAFENKMSQDIIYDAKAIEGTKKLKIKLYPSTISQVVEGLENIFRMPTGCFEQVSSSLYPDVLVLAYMAENKIVDDKIKEKAISYISSGYQKLLTYEVKDEIGGYSLYGKSPANTVLTAYGLLELTDLGRVYPIDTKVTENMKEFVYKKQKSNGTFKTANDNYYVINSTDDLTINAYIIWALSEADSRDDRLKKSAEYLENNIDKMTDNYTVALAANVFANIGDTKNANILAERLQKNINTQSEKYYLNSAIIDYYGTMGRTQNVQTTALTSMVLTKLGKDSKTNAKLIDYIIAAKDSYGTWDSTQATILALRALMTYQTKSDLSNQKVKVTLNGETKEVDINQNALDLYDITFENVDVENHLDISMEKGQISYEIVENYHQDANILKNTSSNKINVTYNLNNNCKVNEKVTQTIKIKNESENLIKNGMAEITIPQGFKVQEETLSKLVSENKIEKYEYNYSKINLYLKNTKHDEELSLDIGYRAMYPGKITGGAVRCYDYYNPDVGGIAVPIEIEIDK